MANVPTTISYSWQAVARGAAPVSDGWTNDTADASGGLPALDTLVAGVDFTPGQDVLVILPGMAAPVRVATQEPAVAPTAITAPSISDATPAPGDTVTITEGTYSGTPSPTLTGTLTLGGVDVTGDMSGLDYTIPGGTADETVLRWSETASNGVGSPVTQDVSATISAVSISVEDPGDGTLEIVTNGDGTITITVSGATQTEYNGTYADIPLTDFDTGPVNLVPAAITGMGEAGQTLTRAYPGLWAYAGTGFSVAQVWQSDDSDITGATGDSYTLTVAEAGATVTLQETATDSNGSRVQDSNGIAVAAISGAMFQDDFNAYANGTDIPTSSPDWEVMASRYNGKMVGDGAGQARLGLGTAASSRIFVAHAGALGADQFARTTYKGLNVENAVENSTEGSVGVRMTPHDAVTANGYYATIEPWRARMRLAKRVGGVSTDLGIQTGITFASGDVVEIRAVGTTITAYRNGNPVLTATDAAITGGKAGLFVFGANAGDHMIVDNFACGEI